MQPLENPVEDPLDKQCTAFDRLERVSQGAALDVVREVKKRVDQDHEASVLIFDDISAEVVDVDLSGDLNKVLEIFRRRTLLGTRTAELIDSLKQDIPASAGRPRLGVVAREVTLLPRHWEWLNLQPGGASVALRKLVEEARRDSSGKDRVRQSQEKAYRFMSAIAGDLPGYEEALRAFYAANADRFDEVTAQWPRDVREYSRHLATDALAP